MKNFSLILFVITIVVSPLIVIAQEKQFMEKSVNLGVEEASLLGWQFKLIQIAASELKKRKLDISKYKVSLFHVGEIYQVAFRDPEMPRRGHRGSSPNMIHFIVEFDANFQILAMYFES